MLGALGNVTSTDEASAMAQSIGHRSALIYNPALGKWVSMIEGIGGVRFPYCSIFMVSPELAAQFLETSIGNRPINDKRVRRYVRSMLSGHWVVNNDDILFDYEGHLINGHHRLNAVIRAKRSIEMSFKFGMDRKSVLVTIDEGKSRSTLDVVHITGNTTTRMAVSAVGYLFEQLNRKHLMPREQLLEEVQRHEEAAKFATQLKKSPFAKNPVHAALMRAWYYYEGERDRLGQFIQIMESGIYANEEEDAGALKLRNLIIANPGCNRTGTDRDQLYRKTEAAIQYFMDKKPVSKLYGNDHELFPLPEEQNR